MQQNSAELLLKLSRSSENTMQSTQTNSAQFPRATNNPRFAVTPETMGMQFRADTSAASRMQQPQYTTPIVDLKSYYERQNKLPAASSTDWKLESSDVLHSTHRITPTHSLRSSSTGHCLPLNASNRSELMPQTPSPISSPQTPLQQWNFEQPTTNSECLQLNARILAADNHNFMQTLKCAEESTKGGGQPSLEATTAAALGQGSPFQCATSAPEMQCHDFCSNHSAKLNVKSINNVFAKRIEDIDANALEDKDLKIFTYQEWVDLLIKINESFLNTMEELEKEVACRLEMMQRRVNSNCRHSQGNEQMKYCKDIDTLLKYIKSTNSNKNWDFLRSLKLETLTPDQVLCMLDFDNLTIEDNGGDELKECGDSDVVQRNKLYANMKALAQEVAEKHDEVRELKRQVICLEDEIQKAQKKIQLKDDVIKELRNDLKCANNKIASSPSLETIPLMTPVSFETQAPSSACTQISDSASAVNNVSQFDSLRRSELEEHEQLKILHDEINDLLEISDLSSQKVEQQRKKIKEVIAKVLSEKLDADRKLDNIKQQLIDLECESCDGKSDSDSGFRSHCENDQNIRLLDTIRQRLRRRSEKICELKKKVQKLELDKNVLSSKLETEASISGRSSDVLKEVADLLCDLSGKQFTYTGIYNSGPCQMNPFCEAIVEIQKDFKAKEAQLLQTVKSKNKENEKLTKVLSELDYYQETHRSLNVNDFENIDKAPVAQLSCTPPPPPPPPPPPSQLSSTLPITVTEPSATSSTVK